MRPFSTFRNARRRYELLVRAEDAQSILAHMPPRSDKPRRQHNLYRVPAIAFISQSVLSYNSSLARDSYLFKMVSVLNTVDTGHEDMIHDAEMDYYGLRLATCSSDNSVKIFDLKNGTQSLVAVLKGHIGPVWQVAWAHPKFGNLLASCSYDRYRSPTRYRLCHIHLQKC